MTSEIVEISKRLFNVPIALHTRAAGTVSELARTTIAGRPGGFRQLAIEVEDRVTFESGIAVIQVRGILVGSDPGWTEFTGYDFIRGCLNVAFRDQAVKAIVLDINSPGGEVAGCFDLVDAIYAARGTKPIWAILSESAYSAAYAIASACDKIIVPRTGGTGSVGVIGVVMEYSQMLEQIGVGVTIFKHGERKADGNPYQPISSAARRQFQSDVDTMGELFVEIVARNRSIPASKVRGLQAATYLGSAGLERGLADQVAAPDEAFALLLRSLSTDRGRSNSSSR